MLAHESIGGKSPSGTWSGRRGVPNSAGSTKARGSHRKQAQALSEVHVRLGEVKALGTQYGNEVPRSEENQELRPVEGVDISEHPRADGGRWDLARLTQPSEDDALLGERGLGEWSSALDAEDRDWDKATGCVSPVAQVMTITLEVPDDLAARLGNRATTLSREALGLAALREGLWTEAQLGRFLGLSRLELDPFLRDHGEEIPYTWADLERERALLDDYLKA